MGETDEKIFKLVIKSEEQRLVYGEVYAPMRLDTDNEAMTAGEIQAAAHRFLSSGKVNKIDVSHDRQESGCLVVESFVARKSDPDGFIEGAWVIGAKILPDELWMKVKKGEINGFSFMAKVKRVGARAKVTVARKIVGETEKSEDGLLPPHSHDMEIDFNEVGRLTPGRTEPELGHSHQVTKATATEKELEHSHRLILAENE